MSSTKLPIAQDQGPALDPLESELDDAPDESLDLPEDGSDVSGDGGAERARGRTMSRKQMSRELRKQQKEGVDPEEAALRAELESMRPRRRSDCVDAPRPCLFVSCKYNLYLDVNPRTGSVKLNFPDKEIWELDYTCALDVADKGGITLEEVGSIMNLTRERVRQVESRGIQGMKVLADDDFERGGGDGLD